MEYITLIYKKTKTDKLDYSVGEINFRYVK